MFKRMLRWLIPITFTLGCLMQPLHSVANVDSIFTPTPKQITVMVSNNFASVDEVKFRQQTAGSYDSLYIVINSPGGDASVMIGMMMAINDLKARGIHVTTEVTHQAMSAGAFLWLMGDTRIVHKNSQLMFHPVYYGDRNGNVLDCSNAGPMGCWMLDGMNNYVRQQLLNILKDTEVVNNIFKIATDNFLTGQEAFDLGLATEIK